MALSLLATARLMDDPNFRWRIIAATAIKAKTEFQRGPGATATQQQGFRFATQVLLQPNLPEMSMIAMCALDPGITSLMEGQPGTVDTSTIPDDEITRAVAAEWANVAKKY